MAKADLQYYGTGRRKSSVARVYLTSGTGKIIVIKIQSTTLLVYYLKKIFSKNISQIPK